MVIILAGPQQQEMSGTQHENSIDLLALPLIRTIRKDRDYVFIMEVFGNLSNPFCKKKIHGQKHPRQKDKCRNSIPYINHCILNGYCQHPVRDNQSPERLGHHRHSILLSVRHLNINYIYIDCVYEFKSYVILYQ